MPLESATYMRGYHVCPNNAHLNVGLPVPDIAWPEKLFGNEIDQCDLMVEFDPASKSSRTKPRFRIRVYAEVGK